MAYSDELGSGRRKRSLGHGYENVRVSDSGRAHLGDTYHSDTYHGDTYHGDTYYSDTYHVGKSRQEHQGRRDGC
jgi:hypothetical protein